MTAGAVFSTRGMDVMPGTDCDMRFQATPFGRLFIAIAAVYLADIIVFAGALRWHVLEGYPQFVEYSPVAAFIMISATHGIAAIMLSLVSHRMASAGANAGHSGWPRDRAWLIAGVAVALLYMLLIILDDRRRGIHLVGIAQLPYLASLVIGGVNYFRCLHVSLREARNRSVLISKRMIAVAIVGIVAFRWVIAVNLP